MSALIESGPQAVERAVALLDSRRVDEALALLTTAEAAGAREASMVLADTFLRGANVPLDVPRAVGHLERAAARPWGPPEHLLAAIHRVGHGVPQDDAAAWHWLQRALAAQHPASVRLAALLRDVAGDPVAAQAGYEAAAQRGDVFAVHALGLLASAAGDQVRARALWMRAPLAVGASRLRRAAPLMPRRAGRPWEASSGAPPWHDIEVGGRSEVLSTEPRVEVRHDALSPVECDYLVTVGSSDLSRSLTIDPRDGRTIDDPARTSSGGSLRRLLPDMVVYLATQRIAALARLPAAHAEPLGVLHYAVGEQYQPHFDWLEDGALAADPFSAQGQRVATVIAYLNQVEAGGATSFPALGLSVAAREGALLCFENAAPDGTPDRRSLHCGESIVRGEKFILTAWFRQRPFAALDRIRDLVEGPR